MLELAVPQSAAGHIMPPTHAAATGAAPAGSAAGSHVSFHDVLSALNPLQYVPVIGTIYRALTGDQIPEALRRIGTFIFSGLTGGPVGALINVAILAAEKISGIDVDKIGQSLLAGNAPALPPVAAATPAPAQIGRRDRPEPLASASLVPAPLVPASAGDLPSAPRSAEAWSPTQLAAYGVSTGLDGTLKLADLHGADVLNSLELSRVRMVRSAYDRATSLAG